MSDRDPLEVSLASLRDNAGLRNNASAPRIERIWERLESNVSGGTFVRRSWSLAWAPALVAGLIVGFLAGHQYESPPTQTPAKLVAEPAGLEPAGPPERQRASDIARAEEPKRDETRGQSPHARTRQTTPLEVPAESVELGEAPVVESVPAAIAGPAPAPPLWLTLADRGEYQRAYHGLEEHGGFDAVLLNASADELMVLVDVARATSNRGRAIQALRRVTQSFVSDPNAPIAAMTLGRMLMQAGDRKGASEAFSLYRRLSPQGDFAEDALASDIQAAVEERNWERARTLAKQYEADFPDGRHLEQIREQLNTAQQTAGPDAEASVDDQSAEVDSVALPPPLDSPY